MVNIASLLISFSADIKGLRGQFAKVNKQVASLSKGFKIAGAALGVLIGGKAIGAIKASIRSFADYNDALAKTSRRLGVSAQFLDEFRFVAARAGVDVNTVDKSIQRMNRRLGDLATTGTGEAAKALKVLGQDLFDAAKAGQGFEKLIPKIADRINQLESATAKASVTQKLFGREGLSFLTIFEKGSKGIAELADRYRELAGVIDEKALKSAEDFNDTLEEFKLLCERLKREVFPPVLEFLNSALQAVIYLKDAITDLTGSGSIAFDKLHKDMRGDDLTGLQNSMRLVAKLMEGMEARAQDIVRQITKLKKESGLVEQVWELMGVGGIVDLQLELFKINQFLDSHGRLLKRAKAAWLEMHEASNRGAEEQVEVQEKVVDGLSRQEEKVGELAAAYKEAVDAIEAHIDQIAEVTAEKIKRMGDSLLTFIKGTEDAFARAVATMVVTGQGFADVFASIMRGLLIGILAEVVKFTIAIIAQAITRLVVNILAAEAQKGIIGFFVGLAVVGGLVGLALATASSQSKRSSAQEGGFVSQTGLVNVHAGEVIGDVDDVIAGLNGGGGGQTINVLMNNEVVARAAVIGMPREVNLRVGNL